MQAIGSDFLYEQLAHELGRSIETGALRVGERLPSVRRLAEDRAVSVATVVQAYLRLENQGLVEVRPKMGHFVRARRSELAEPRPPRKATQPSKVAISDRVAAVSAALGDPRVVPLGQAYLDAELLPIAALNRTLAQLAREASTAGARYDFAPGLSTLRHQLARRAVSWGVPLHEDDFVTTVGATEAITLALRAVATAGDTIVVESPCYFGLLQAIEGLGLRALEVPAHPRTGMDLDLLEDALRGARAAAIVVSSNASNPLGSIMPDEGKERLVALARRHDLAVVDDDIYGDLVFDGTRPRPLRAFDPEGRVLLVGSVSKTLAPGYRVGWIAPGRYLDAVVRLKLSQSLASPTLTQMAVAELLASGGYDRHIRRLRGVLGGQVERYRTAISDTFPEGTRVSCPRGGFVLWVELPPGTDALELHQRALERHVAIAPGPIFSARERFGNHIRVSCGIPWGPRVERAIALLGELADASRRAGNGRRPRSS